MQNRYVPDVLPFDSAARCQAIAGAKLCTTCERADSGLKTPQHFIHVPMDDRGKCRCYKARSYANR